MTPRELLHWISNPLANVRATVSAAVNSRVDAILARIDSGFDAVLTRLFDRVDRTIDSAFERLDQSLDRALDRAVDRAFDRIRDGRATSDPLLVLVLDRVVGMQGMHPESPGTRKDAIASRTVALRSRVDERRASLVVLY